MTLAPVPSESRRTALEPLDPLPPHLLGVGPNDARAWSSGNQGHDDPAAVLEGEELLVVPVELGELLGDCCGAGEAAG